jgi:hypothetical protein
VEIDSVLAAALGWPKLKYAAIERERRWLCRMIPHDRVIRSETFRDRYIFGTQLRLREALPIGGGEAKRRLGRKADVSRSVRLMTSIYLAPEEYRVLETLPAKVLTKTRHYLGMVGGAELTVDRFEGPLKAWSWPRRSSGTWRRCAPIRCPTSATRK